ncbi:MAG: DUF5722 domain-containing protein [Firmicutes bacterium]|nr:DUF5722 domain-containing protein [Bacillota bacterium]
MKRIIAVVISAAFMMPLFGAFLFAGAKSGSGNLPRCFENVDARMIESVTGKLIDGFETDNVLWTASDGGGTQAEINICGELGYKPYIPLDGGVCLEATAEKAGMPVVLQREWKNGASADIRGAKYFVIVMATSEPDSSYRVTADFKSGQRTAKVTEIAEGGGWNAVFFDISGFADMLENVIGLSLTFERIGSDTDMPVSVALDRVGLSYNSESPFAMRFLAFKYKPFGCELSVSNGMEVSFHSEDPYIETEALSYGDFSGNRAVSIRLVNESNCKSITLMYISGDGESYTNEKSITRSIDVTSAVQTCVFAVPDHIAGFRLIFSGNLRGTVTLLSVGSVSSYTPSQYPAEVKLCGIAQNGEDIELRGAFRSGMGGELRGDTLFLYTAEIYEETAGIPDEGRSAAAKTYCGGGDFSFVWKGGVSSGGAFKKYIITAYDGENEMIIAHESYVTNPEILAEQSGSAKRTQSKKGMVINGGVDSGLYGSAYAEITVDLVKLLTDSADGYRFEYNGRIFCFDREFTDQLSESMRVCAEERAKVYITLIATPVYRSVAGSALIHPHAEADAGYCAFNTETQDGVETLRAACSFLAERFAGSGPLEGVVVGDDVSDCIIDYSMGRVSLTQLVLSYAEAFRTVYAAFRSFDAELDICISLGCNWNLGLSSDAVYSFDSRTFIDVFNEVVKTGGDINWKLAYDPYPGQQSYISHNDINLLNSFESKQITMGNISQLIGYMTRERMYFRGDYRDIVLIEHDYVNSKSSAVLKALAADYAYSYYIVTNANYSLIKAYIVNRDLSFNDIYTLIDTNKTLDVTKFALELFGASEWQQLIPAFDSSGIAVRVSETSELLRELPEGITGRAKLFSFTDDASGWYPLDDGVTFSAGASLGSNSDLLNISLHKPCAESRRGIANDFGYIIDLSVAPVLTFSAQTAVLPEGVTEARIVVTVHSGLSDFTASGVIYAGKWNQVFADLSGYKDISRCDKITIRLESVDGEDLGEPTLLIGGIDILSKTHNEAEIVRMLEDARSSDGENEGITRLEWILVGVIAAAALTELLYIAKRLSRLKRAG